MNQRYFTLEEAEALLPQLEKIMATVRDLKGRIDSKISGWQEQALKKPSETALAKGQVDFLIAEINRQLEAVHNLGCLAKDLDSGLVDFPARVEGKEAYLCWRFGEKKITHWHGLTEGFQGRKPLRRPTPKAT
jgi:hypothetical protein